MLPQFCCCVEGTIWLLAPVSAAVVAAPGIANAARPGDPGGPAGGTPTPTTTKKIIHLPFLKVEFKRVEGQQPKIKFVPFPNVDLPKK
jgi:hypothetical protein